VSRYCDLIGHEVAKDILRDVVLAELFVPILRPVFSVVTQTAVSIAGGDPDNDASAFAALSRLLAPPGTTLPEIDRHDFLANAFDASEGAFTDPEVRLAQWVARVFGAIARTALAGAVADETARPDAPPPRQPPADTVEAAATRELDATDEGRTALQRMRDAGIFDAAQAASAASGSMAAAAVVAPGAFVNFLRAVANWLASVCPDLHWAPAAMVEQIALTTARAGIAAAIAGTVEAVPFNIRSSAAIGNHVHRRIQLRYEGRRAAIADIVTERWNPIINFADQVVIGPTTGGSPMPLGDMTGPFDVDWFFRCFRFALASPRIERETWLRADLVDRARLEIWEIKPMLGLVSGVWQEAIYRNSFNLLRYLLVCIGVRPLTGPLSPGGALIGPADTRLGVSGGMLTALSAINVSRQAGQPALAIPFQVVMLPGMVPYAVFRSPSQGEIVLVLTAVLARALLEAMRQARRLAREMGRLVDEALEALSDWATPENIAMAVLAIVIVILAIAAVVLTGGAAAIPEAGALGGGATAGAGTAAAGAGVGAGIGAAIAEGFAAFMAFLEGAAPAVLRFAPAAGGILLVIPPDALQSQDETTMITLHGITLDGIPVEAAGPFLAGLGTTLEVALGDVAQRLARSRRSGSRPVA
jgi:hypothetical protein